ncbi:hypothetical protein [Streptomyces sp. NBC_01268]|uniref:hypothetical protein n=1 Tax=Streptomyces sp. NBC_01268 TaxID=2903806 RepID=UPI002E3706F7|nr:hypothetical protein [Streptomyces sp. NBC_01268]
MPRMNALPDVPRWAAVAAHAVPFLVLPAGLWRLGLAFGLPFAVHSPYSDPGPRMLAYMIGLTVLSELLALLTLGLVRGWGEVFPRWLPLLGGRPVPVRAATGAALAGAAGLLAAASWSGYAVYAGLGEGDGTELTAAQDALFLGCYLPLGAWPVLLAAVAVAYHRRRSGRAGRRGAQ